MMRASFLSHVFSWPGTGEGIAAVTQGTEEVFLKIHVFSSTNKEPA